MLLLPTETFIRFSMKGSQLKTKGKEGWWRKKGRKKGHTYFNGVAVFLCFVRNGFAFSHYVTLKHNRKETERSKQMNENAKNVTLSGFCQHTTAGFRQRNTKSVLQGTVM